MITLKKNQIISVVGARPNFMKIAPIIRQFNLLGIENILVHTGQHYDKNMSDSFFSDLKLPKPDISMGVGSGSHAVQTSKIMVEFEKICNQLTPRVVIVAGDVNSTLACALVAVKCHIPLAHVEAGLRSNDMKMPEEVNRILTDRISDILFVTEKSAVKNLKKEGVSKDKIHFVGNCMIDSLKMVLPSAISSKPWEKYNLQPQNFLIVTLHRPSNVDNTENLKNIFNHLNIISKKVKIIFPVHPRTKRKIEKYQIVIPESFLLVPPLPYIEFIGLMAKSLAVITDSGGIQEETTFLGVRCITLRQNTERPITIEKGTNILIGDDILKLEQSVDEIINNNNTKRKIPKKWDGSSSKRIVKILLDYLEQ